MYEGLPIITNKIPEHERKGIVHHLLGYISLNEPSWTVQEFLPEALTIIEEIRGRDKLPILVGGTHYYIQALLFKDHTLESHGTDPRPPTPPFDDFPILEESTEVILEKLREVDPVMANRWHPNDRRKIQRSLQIYLRTGQQASERYLGRLKDVNSQNQEMRFPTLLLWPHCEREDHKLRLDRRVSRMLEQGLLDEVAQLMALRKTGQEGSDDIDFTKGVWQAIGFRQFEPYQKAINHATVDETQLDKLKISAVEQTQASTRRYANSQLKWIRVKLLNALVRANALQNLFILDGTDLDSWKSSVIEPSIMLTEQFLGNEPLPEPISIYPAAAELLSATKEDLTHSPESWGVQTCDVCGTKAATPQLWKQHLDSRGHRIRTSKKKAQERKDLVASDQVRTDTAD